MDNYIVFFRDIVILAPPNFTQEGRVMGLHRFPEIDLRDRNSADFPKRVVHAFRSQGFLAVRGHSAGNDLLDEAERLTTQLFTDFDHDALERQYGRPHIFRQRGFCGMCLERAAADGSGAPRPPPDLKCFWMIRDPQLPWDTSDNPYGNNIWPAELPRFRTVMLWVMSAYKEVYLTLLEAVAQGYDLSKDQLKEMARGAESMLRPIFYPRRSRLKQMGIETPEGAKPSAPHGDINALTIIRPKPGLWAKLNGRWVQADASDPSILWVNIGEMLAQVQGIDGDLVPTIHCVGTPPGERDPVGDYLLQRDRVALPLFGHFCRSAYLRPGLRVGDWFDQRIREITQG